VDTYRAQVPSVILFANATSVREREGFSEEKVWRIERPLERALIKYLDFDLVFI
jgi:hypothetical protein